jgi:hypothetical protein
MHEDHRKTPGNYKYSIADIAGYNCTCPDKIGMKKLEIKNSN